MSTKCYNSIQGLAMRVTALDSTGKWTTGASGAAVSDGFISIGLSGNWETGSEYKQKKANGALCINKRNRDQLNWYDTEIQFCNVDPAIYKIVTGTRLLNDYKGDAVGFTVPIQQPAAKFALEVWTAVGTPTDALQWVYWLLPASENGVIGDMSIADEVMTFTLRSNSAINPNYGKGPWDVVAQDAGLTPGVLLSNVAADEHLYHRLTEIAPPTSVCGFQAAPVNWTTPV